MFADPNALAGVDPPPGGQIRLKHFNYRSPHPVAAEGDNEEQPPKKSTPTSFREIAIRGKQLMADQEQMHAQPPVLPSPMANAPGKHTGITGEFDKQGIHSQSQGTRSNQQIAANLPEESSLQQPVDPDDDYPPGFWDEEDKPGQGTALPNSLPVQFATPAINSSQPVVVLEAQSQAEAAQRAAERMKMGPMKSYMNLVTGFGSKGDHESLQEVRDIASTQSKKRRLSPAVTGSDFKAFAMGSADSGSQANSYRTKLRRRKTDKAAEGEQ